MRHQSTYKLPRWNKVITLSEQSNQIKENWIGAENFDNCFWVIFDHCYKNFTSGRKTEH